MLPAFAAFAAAWAGDWVGWQAYFRLRRLTADSRANTARQWVSALWFFGCFALAAWFFSLVR